GHPLRPTHWFRGLVPLRGGKARLHERGRGVSGVGGDRVGERRRRPRGRARAGRETPFESQRHHPRRGRLHPGRRLDGRGFEDDDRRKRATGDDRDQDKLPRAGQAGYAYLDGAGAQGRQAAGHRRGRGRPGGRGRRRDRGACHGHLHPRRRL
ncbi:MAG: hypothetical protein AVDCRST_MAG78-152, partial [uncultured Rubrobacteraceae bacterium]